MTKMANPNEIKKVIEVIKKKRFFWKLSHRSKNYQTLSILGLGEEAIFNIIYNDLSWRDYSSGPLLDDHIPPIPGNIWIFGLTISNQKCYLKFQDKPSGIIMWISIHKQEYPLYLPYK